MNQLPATDGQDDYDDIRALLKPLRGGRDPSTDFSRNLLQEMRLAERQAREGDGSGAVIGSAASPYINHNSSEPAVPCGVGGPEVAEQTVADSPWLPSSTASLSERRTSLGQRFVTGHSARSRLRFIAAAFAIFTLGLAAVLLPLGGVGTGVDKTFDLEAADQEIAIEAGTDLGDDVALSGEDDFVEDDGVVSGEDDFVEDDGVVSGEDDFVEDDGVVSGEDDGTTVPPTTVEQTTVPPTTTPTTVEPTGECATEDAWRFVRPSGNGDGCNIAGRQIVVLRGNGVGVGERFRVGLEGCDFVGSLVVTAPDGSKLTVTSGLCLASAVDFPSDVTFLVPSTGEVGITLELVDPNGSYRIATYNAP